METWFAPTQPTPLPAARKVLVLAPHPDDEIFGCGGAIALYAQQGVPVQVHLLTDGAGYAPQAQRAQLRATRTQESQRALALLGSGIDCESGPYQDRGLLQESGLIAHVLALLERHQPDLVLAPSPWEIHPDHQACARAAAAAIAQWRRRTQADVGLLLYEIGAPLRPNLLLDITAVWALKAQAMHSFASQLEQQDYAWHLQGLNAYRTYTLPPQVRYAEAYHYLAANDIAAPHGGAQAASGDLAAQCLDHWVQSALHSASVHAEDLQQALLAQSRLNTGLQQQRERDNQEFRQEIHRLEQENREFRREFERVQQENQQHLQEIQRHQHDHLRLQQDHQRLQQQVQAAETALQQQIQAAETALQQQQQAHAQALQHLYASTSWRVTAPLRALRRWLRR